MQAVPIRFDMVEWPVLAFDVGGDRFSELGDPVRNRVQTHETTWEGVTEAPFVNSSVSKISNLRWHMLNINVILNN